MKKTTSPDYAEAAEVVRVAHVPLKLTFWQAAAKLDECDIVLPVPLTRRTIAGLELLGLAQRLSPEGAVILLAKAAVSEQATELARARNVPDFRCDASVNGDIAWA